MIKQQRARDFLAEVERIGALEKERKQAKLFLGMSDDEIMTNQAEWRKLGLM